LHEQLKVHGKGPYERDFEYDPRQPRPAQKQRKDTNLGTKSLSVIGGIRTELKLGYSSKEGALLCRGHNENHIGRR